MVDRTPNRNYAYPECDPPLVKDRSDIRYLGDLARDVNSDAIVMSNRILDLLENPDTAMISMATGVTGPIFTVPYDFSSWDEGGVVDLGAQGIRVQERGFYFFTSTVFSTSAGNVSLMCRHLRNGKSYQEGRRFEGPARSVVGTTQSMSVSDVLSLQSGDLVQTQVKFDDTVAGIGPHNFECRLTMIQMLKLDV